MCTFFALFYAPLFSQDLEKSEIIRDNENIGKWERSLRKLERISCHLLQIIIYYTYRYISVPVNLYWPNQLFFHLIKSFNRKIMMNNLIILWKRAYVLISFLLVFTKFEISHRYRIFLNNVHPWIVSPFLKKLST